MNPKVTNLDNRLVGVVAEPEGVLQRPHVGLLRTRRLEEAFAMLLDVQFFVSMVLLFTELAWGAQLAV